MENGKVYECTSYKIVESSLNIRGGYVPETPTNVKKKSDLQNLVNVFGSVCKRRKLKLNVNKSKVMVCEWSSSEAVDFVCPYRVGTECEKECKIILNGEEMEVNEFKYLGSSSSSSSFNVHLFPIMGLDRI